MAYGKWTAAPYFYKDRPLIISHRGASGYIPENSMQAYQVAGTMGTDYIELDILVSKEGDLVIHHDITLDDTTNVAEFPNLSSYKTTKSVKKWNGTFKKTGWFAEDLTMEQLKLLTLKQRKSMRPQSLNYYFHMPTLREVLEWLIEENVIRTNAKKELLGVVIETKYPGYFNELGYDVEKLLMDVLTDLQVSDIKQATDRCPIIIQSFELDSMIKIDKMTDLPTSYLMGSGGPTYNITEYVDIVSSLGVDFDFIFKDNESTGFVEKAHGLGFAVNGWTVRDDDLPSGLTAQQFYDLMQVEGLDGAITEFPDSAYDFFSSS